MKNWIHALIAATLVVSFNQAHAHRMWILPSSTVLSGDGPWVVFDAAISNTLFHVDHVPMRLDDVHAQSPDGKMLDLQNAGTGIYRSTFDLQLNQEGTYKVARVTGGGLSARWENANGERQIWPGRGQQVSEAEFLNAVPADAANLQVSRNYSRAETFVTLGAPTFDVFEPAGQGLEFVPVTHPNDLYSGETARFQLLMDGEPAVGAEVQVVPGGMRYRADQKEMNLVTDAEGYFQVAWPEAGMYFIEATYSDDQAAAPAMSRSGTYSVTLEVLPL